MKKLFISVLVGLGIIGSGYAMNVGSVAIGNGYIATTTTTMVAGNRMQTECLSELGSVIIASSSGFSLELRNATSTTDVASTSIATFKASAGEGTYTFDTRLTRGLALNIPASFNGAFTITCR